MPDAGTALASRRGTLRRGGCPAKIPGVIFAGQLGIAGEKDFLIVNRSYEAFSSA